MMDLTFCSPRPLTRRTAGLADAPITREELDAKLEEIARGLAVTRERRGAAPQLQEGCKAREAAIEILVAPALVQAEERKKAKYAAAVNRQPTNPQDAPAAITFMPLVISSAGTCTGTVSAMLRQLAYATARQRRNEAGSLWTAPTKASIMRKNVGILSRFLQDSAAAFFSGARVG
jgi:hypothetical protein